MKSTGSGIVIRGRSCRSSWPGFECRPCSRTPPQDAVRCSPLNLQSPDGRLELGPAFQAMTVTLDLGSELAARLKTTAARAGLSPAKYLQYWIEQIPEVMPDEELTKLIAASLAHPTAAPGFGISRPVNGWATCLDVRVGSLPSRSRPYSQTPRRLFVWTGPYRPPIPDSGGR